MRAHVSARRRDQGKEHFPQWIHQQEKQSSDGGAERDGTGEYRPQRDGVIRSESLRGESCGSHPQKTEQPECNVDHHRSDGNGADEAVRAEMAGYRRVAQAQQRHRDITQYRRYAQSYYLSVDSHFCMLIIISALMDSCLEFSAKLRIIIGSGKMAFCVKLHVHVNFFRQNCVGK